MSIANNLMAVRERIARACERAGRSPGEVTLVGVTKGQPAQAVVEAVTAGLEDVGENRVQEAAAKIERAAALGARPRWHLVGHLQTNKAKAAAGLFAIIQSVDSPRLAQALSNQARAPLPVLLEVNVAQEATKFGFTPEQLRDALEDIRRLPNIDVRGLMTVAPQGADPEKVRPVFRQLRELRDELGLHELSMGMTDDFEVAVEEGATIVRVGRAIFGHNPGELEDSPPTGPGALEDSPPTGPGGLEDSPPTGPGGLEDSPPTGPGGLGDVPPTGPGGLGDVPPTGPGGLEDSPPAGPGGLGDVPPTK